MMVTGMFLFEHPVDPDWLRFTLERRLLERMATLNARTVFDVGAVEFVPCDTPSKPERWFPASGAKLTTQVVTLDWIGPDCAKTFSVIVRQGSKIGAIVFSKSNIKATQVKTTALAKNQKYVWQVTACKGTKCAKSSWGKFTVK